MKTKMTIKERKKAIRRQMLTQRANLNLQFKKQYDNRICDEIWQLIETYHYRTVHCYLPMGSEIDILPLIERMSTSNITVVMPKTLPKGQMQNLVFKSLNDLEHGIFGTRHPGNAEVFCGNYDLIVVPGLAFDPANFRLGYGGGYYDRLLMNQPLTHKQGICYPFQMMSSIPIEPHDVQLDHVLIKG